jgi:hypothetical protein
LFGLLKAVTEGTEVDVGDYAAYRIRVSDKTSCRKYGE